MECARYSNSLFTAHKRKYYETASTHPPSFTHLSTTDSAHHLLDPRRYVTLPNLTGEDREPGDGARVRPRDRVLVCEAGVRVVRAANVENGLQQVSSLLQLSKMDINKCVVPSLQQVGKSYSLQKRGRV